MATTTLTRPRRRWWCDREPQLWMLPATPVWLASIDPSPDLRSALVGAAATWLVLLLAWASWTAPGSPRSDGLKGLAWLLGWVGIGSALGASLTATGGVPLWLAVNYPLLGAAAVGWGLRARHLRRKLTLLPEKCSGRARWLGAGLWVLLGAVVLALLSEPPALWVQGASIAVAALSHGLLETVTETGAGGCRG